MPPIDFELDFEPLQNASLVVYLPPDKDNKNNSFSLNST